MTFEEFKKDFEIFHKLNTPYMVALCEKQYRTHLLMLEDEEHFQPRDTDEDDDDKYIGQLYGLLQFKMVSADQYNFLSAPSFEPESVLAIERQPTEYKLSFTTLDKSYWTALYDGDENKVEKISSAASLDTAMGDKLFMLFKKVITSAQPKKAMMHTLDGTVYRLAGIINDELTVVQKHSPNESSRSGKVIKLMEQLAKYTVDQDKNMLPLISAAIEEQLNLYKAL